MKDIHSAAKRKGLTVWKDDTTGSWHCREDKLSEEDSLLSTRTFNNGKLLVDYVSNYNHKGRSR